MNVNLKYENGWSFYHRKLLKTFPIKKISHQLYAMEALSGKSMTESQK